MSIATAIERLQTAKNNLKESIVARKEPFTLTTWGLAASNQRCFCFTSRPVVGGETIYVKLNDYSSLQWDAIVISSNTWGTGTVYVESGWIQEEASWTVPVSVPMSPVYYLRFQFRHSNNSTITIEEVESAIETLTISNSIADDDRLDTYYQHIDRLPIRPPINSFIQKAEVQNLVNDVVLNNSNITPADLSAYAVQNNPTATRAMICFPVENKRNWSVSYTVGANSPIKYYLHLTKDVPNINADKYQIVFEKGWLNSGATGTYTYSSYPTTNYIIIDGTYTSTSTGIPTFQEFTENLTFEITSQKLGPTTRSEELLANTTTIAASKYRDNTTLVDVLLPDTITTLGNWAFSSNRHLTHINLDNVTTIGNRAFESCPYLASVNLSSLTGDLSVTFGSCYRLRYVESLGACTALLGGDVEAKGVFSSTQIREITLPDTCTLLGKHAFRDCYQLEYVNLGKVTTIQTGAFNSCSNLKIIVDMPNLTGTLPTQVFTYSGILKIKSLGTITNIEDSGAANTGTFSSCPNLDEAHLPDTLTRIGNNAFRYDYALKSIEFGTGLTSIGSYALSDCSSLSEIDLSDTQGNNLVLNNSVFRFDKSLTSVHLPTDIKFGSGFNFAEQNSNSSYSADIDAIIDFDLDMSDSTDTIMPACNFYKSYIKSVSSLGSITVIADHDNNRGVFGECKYLQSVVLPSNITRIGHYAFRYDTRLTTINFPTSITYIGWRTFENCPITGILNLPNLTAIGDHAFTNSRFSKVTDLGSITTIYESTFESSTSLTEVSIPSTVTSIGNHAFRGCSSLTTINLNNSQSSITTIGHNSFDGCPLTGILNLPLLTSIGYHTFTGNRFSEIILPSLTTIGDYGLQGGTNSPLTKVTLSDCFVSFTGYHNLDNHPQLSTVILPSTTVPSMANLETFSRTALIWVPSSSIDDYRTATNWKLYTPKLREIGETYDYGTLTPNKRFNGSNIVDATGYYISDYIPVTGGNVIRATGSANLGNCQINYYDSSYTYVSNHNQSPNPYYNPANQYTVPSTAAYARIVFYQQPNNEDPAVGIYDETAQALLYPSKN